MASDIPVLKWTISNLSGNENLRKESSKSIELDTSQSI
jgi:hypothetical protein